VRSSMGCSCSVKTANYGLVRCSKHEVFQLFASKGARTCRKNPRQPADGDAWFFGYKKGL
jgi:hypothetical protein